MPKDKNDEKKFVGCQMPIWLIDEISVMAKDETRSFSNSVVVLLAEALEARESKQKKLKSSA